MPGHDQCSSAEALKQASRVLDTLARRSADKQLDHWILGETTKLQTQVLSAYDDFAFNRALTAIQEFLPKLSTTYMDSVKDDLYCSAEQDPYRLGAVATLGKVHDALLRLMAPITPYLAEELHEHAAAKGAEGAGQADAERSGSGKGGESVFMRGYERLEWAEVQVPLLDLKLKGMDVAVDDGFPYDCELIRVCHFALSPGRADRWRAIDSRLFTSDKPLLGLATL